MSTIENGKTYWITSMGSPTAKRRLSLYSSGTVKDALNVVLYTPDNTKEQKWLFRDSRLYITTTTAYCLDRYNLPASANHNNADVYKATVGEDANQKIDIFASGTGHKIKLKSQDLYLTAHSDVNGTGNGKKSSSSGNVYWSKNVDSKLQLWAFEDVNELAQSSKTVQATRGGQTKPSGQATSFPAASFYNAANNPLYPAYTGECTWYCLGRAHEVKNIKGLPATNAKTWYDSAKKLGFKVTGPSDAPVAKSIAVWTKGSYGHVAFVENVANGVVYFSEANWYAPGDARLSNKKAEPPPMGTDGQLKTASIAQFKARYAPFAGCIIL